MSKASKTPKKTARPAERKRATSRLFPYAKVAEMWRKKRPFRKLQKRLVELVKVVSLGRRSEMGHEQRTVARLKTMHRTARGQIDHGPRMPAVRSEPLENRDRPSQPRLARTPGKQNLDGSREAVAQLGRSGSHRVLPQRNGSVPAPNRSAIESYTFAVDR